MHQSPGLGLSPSNSPSQEGGRAKMQVDVSKPFEHRQIDTRWVELKMNSNILPRSYFASCIQAGKVFIHGGYNEERGILGDMYSAQFYDLPSTWVRLQPLGSKSRAPPPLRNHTLCVYTSFLILIGGQKSMLENNEQIYRFDLRTNEWAALKVNFLSQKAVLSLDSHIAKVYNDHLYLYGGYNSANGQYLSQTLKLDLRKVKDGEVDLAVIEADSKSSPSPRGNMSACVLDNLLFIFGGANSEEIFDDFWSFNLEAEKWQPHSKEEGEGKKGEWPEKRRGQIMVPHSSSRSIFMFGGIKEITKEQNDIMVFLKSKEKWVRIHRNTNELYDPSPTIKKQIENSPSVIEAKNKKSRSRSKGRDSNGFKIGIKSVTCYNKAVTEGSQNMMEDSSGAKEHFKSLKTHHFTSYGGFGSGESPTFKKQMSVVQEKKYREFLNRKKKLLGDINSNTMGVKSDAAEKRAHSPTSETLIYSINSIGEQRKYQDESEELPKVIFDEEKGALIGKKPCARDGHAGLCHEDSIIIIGGDRHMMSFNDVYLFKMDKAIQNIHHYDIG